jgi:DNA mismatch endonuclease (patch repair protein)
VSDSTRVSWAANERVRNSMRSNRGHDTKPEVDLRSALHRAGVRFFKHRRPLQGLRCEADVLFPRRRLAVFVDGCFWHGCPLHATWPATHREFWEVKLSRNRTRDDFNSRTLTRAGWVVLRLWEHQPLSEMYEAVLAALADVSNSDGTGATTSASLRIPRQSDSTDQGGLAAPSPS